jgi:hypothetical protein
MTAPKDCFKYLTTDSIRFSKLETDQKSKEFNKT